MNWDEFTTYLKKHHADLNNPPTLLMSGATGDNATRYLLKQKGVLVNHHQAALLNGNHDERDFVWPGRDQVRVMGKYEGGGHPALAGFGDIACAGRTEGDHFFFHSGHYHPKAEHALIFLLAFVRNSCANLDGQARDESVHDLCSIKHRLYADQSETVTYLSSLSDLLRHQDEGGHDHIIETGHAPFKGSYTRSQPMSIGGSSSSGFIKKSAPIPIGRSKPIPIGQNAFKPIDEEEDFGPTVALSGTQLTLSSGLSQSGRHQRSKSVEGRALWMDDSASLKCLCCSKAFTTFRRKHHCRQCGQLVCDDCSQKRKQVLLPAIRPNKEAESGAVRVCDTCIGMGSVNKK